MSADDHVAAHLYYVTGKVNLCTVCGHVEDYSAEQALTWVKAQVWPKHCGQPMQPTPPALLPNASK